MEKNVFFSIEGGWGEGVKFGWKIPQLLMFFLLKPSLIVYENRLNSILHKFELEFRRPRKLPKTTQKLSKLGYIVFMHIFWKFSRSSELQLFCCLLHCDRDSNKAYQDPKGKK